MLLKIVSEMSRDNFNKINVVAKRTCKYFFVHIQIINQTIFIHHKQFNFRCNVNERLSRYIFFHNIDVDIRNKKIKKCSNSKLFVNKLIVNHHIENCEWYEIKHSIMKTTNNWFIKLCFFWIIQKNVFSNF